MKKTDARKRRIWIAVLLGIADIVLLASLFVLFCGEEEAEEKKRDVLAQAIGQQAEQMSEEEMEEARLMLISDALRHVQYNAEPILADGQVDLYLSNGEESGCIVCAEVKRLDTGEVIGTIGLIDPGYRLEKMNCTAKLPAGDHACQMILHVYDLSGVYLGRAGRHMMLTVK